MMTAISHIDTVCAGCVFFQLCDHRSLSSKLTAIFHDDVHLGNPQVEWEKALPAAADAIKCYSKRLVEMHAEKWANLVSSKVFAV